VLFALASAKPKWNQLGDYTFEKYTSDFGKKYQGAEYSKRHKIFDEKLKAIKAHNSKSSSYRQGVNHLTDLTHEELRQMNGGGLNGMYNHAMALQKKPHVKKHVTSDFPLPRAVDYTKSIPSILTAVKDQGMCGSCWAHGATENLETYWAMSTGDLYVLSQQQITACAPNPDDCGGTGGCGGSIVELAWDYVIGAGISQEWVYPYTAYSGTTGVCNPQQITPVVQISAYTSVMSNDQKSVLDALAHVGPLAINVDASSWSSYESGIFDGCDYAYNISIDHVVQLVGYGTDVDLGMDYWLVRNSWSPGYGENGFIRLLKTDTVQCGWDVNPQDGTGCNGGPNELWTCGMCGILFDTLYPNVSN